LYDDALYKSTFYLLTYLHSTSHGIVTPACESLISAGGAEHAAQKYDGLENGQLDSSGPKEEISQDNVGDLTKKNVLQQQ